MTKLRIDASERGYTVVDCRRSHDQINITLNENKKDMRKMNKLQLKFDGGRGVLFKFF